MEQVRQLYSEVSKAISGDASSPQKTPLLSRYIVKRIRWKHLCRKLLDTNKSSISFHYPVFLLLSDVEQPSESSSQHPTSFPGMFKISQNVNEYNAVANSLLWNGLERCEQRHLCNLFWSKPLKSFTSLHKTPFQRVNHFPGSSAIANKSKMAFYMTLKEQQLGKNSFCITPQTFLLPSSRQQAEEAMKSEPETLWIWKPSSGSCGKGISILSSSSQLPQQTPAVLCRYIPNPLLINGFKFDLRLYVVVTSYDPLRVYLYDDGLVRFSTRPYSNNPESLGDLKVHLTNYSVNKKTDTFKFPEFLGSAFEGPIECNQGSKWSVQGLMTFLATHMKVNIPELRDKINDLIVKSLIAVEDAIVTDSFRANCPRFSCFELYGFDVLIDSEMEPWLVEVNMLPSLSSSSQLDKAVKTSLMTDLLHLVRIPAVDPLRWAKEPNYCSLLHCPTRSAERMLDLERLGQVVKLDVEYLENSRDDQLMVLEVFDEFQRKRHFDRLFPLKESTSKYAHFFSTQRYYNLLQFKFLELDNDEQRLIIDHFFP